MLVVLYLCQITARDIVGVVLYVEASVCFVAEYVKIFGIGLEGSVVDFLCFAFQVGYVYTVFADLDLFREQKKTVVGVVHI